MKPSKGIEILENLIRDKTSNLITNEQDAIKLGKEALKHMREERRLYAFNRHDQLPGEDPE